MYLETFLPYLKPAFLFNSSISLTEEDEMCASLMASFCPEIITLLNSPPKTNESDTAVDVSENDEHTDGLV